MLRSRMLAHAAGLTARQPSREDAGAIPAPEATTPGSSTDRASLHKPNGAQLPPAAQDERQPTTQLLIVNSGSRFRVPGLGYSPGTPPNVRRTQRCQKHEAWDRLS